jgi:uncharacterized protein YjbI with pentapeptide repeats
MNGSNLSQIDFRWANFHKADFSEANLNEVDFTRAKFYIANFNGADLSMVVWDENTIWPKGIGPLNDQLTES